MLTINEVFVTILLFLWVTFVIVVVTKIFYAYMIRRGMLHNVAIYYNRKIIHMFAGGISAALVPFVFETYFLPLVMSIFLAIFTYIPHKIGKLMYWFQTEDNMYEVSFAIMWGLIITLGWFFSGGNFMIGVIPVLFMSVGDAITGIVRNYLYKKRTKSWWGNLAMAIFSIIAGSLLGVAGILAGITASIIEHFEFYPIDDNITVPLISFLVLIFANSYAPWLLKF